MKKILVTGGTGLVGKTLVNGLLEKGYQVNILSRSKRTNDLIKYFVWNIDEMYIDEEAFDGVTDIIHLAGAGVGDKRWTKSYKKMIYDSRIKSAQLLNKYIAKNDNIQTFISASAIGYYQNSGDKWLTEDSTPSNEFISEVCVDWENEVKKAEKFDVRTSSLRVGLVIANEDGVLPKLTLTLPLGFLNYLGSGDQYFSWIHIEDLVSMFIYVLENSKTKGVYNATAPNPTKQKDFLRAIGKAKGKNISLIPVPEFALKIGMGEMARVVLASQRCSAEKILAAGFEFNFSKIDFALNDLLKD